jgi:hypothetical protein
MYSALDSALQLTQCHHTPHRKPHCQRAHLLVPVFPEVIGHLGQGRLVLDDLRSVVQLEGFILCGTYYRRQQKKGKLKLGAKRRVLRSW